MNLAYLADSPPWTWPADAGEILLEILRDYDHEESERILAAELAGDYTVINDEIAEVLMSLLKDASQSDKLRGQAVISLGPALESADIYEFYDPDDVPISENQFLRIQAALTEYFRVSDFPKFVRRRILEASIRAPQEWHNGAVEAAYNSGDDEWKQTAIFCMGCIKGFDKQILEALNSENSDLLFEAVRSAGGHGIKSAWNRILSIIDNQDITEAMLTAAVEAASDIHPIKAENLFIDHANADVRETFKMIRGDYDYD